MEDIILDMEKDKQGTYVPGKFIKRKKNVRKRSDMGPKKIKLNPFILALEPIDKLLKGIDYGADLLQNLSRTVRKLNNLK